MNVFISGGVIEPTEGFLKVLFNAYTIIMAETGAVHTHCIAIVCGKGVVLEGLRLIFFYSDAHFIADTYSFIIEFLFCRLFEISECFFTFI